MRTETVSHEGRNAVTDAILAGYPKRSALKQQRNMVNGIERLMRTGNRKQNPIEPNKADILPWYLYDEINVPSGTTTGTEVDFFSVPIGGTQFTTVKTKQQTNLEEVSKLSAPKHFNTTSLQIYFQASMLKADIDSALNNFWLEFWISDKIYAEGPLFKFPGGAGLSGATAVSGQSIWSNGLPSPIAVVDFRMGDNPIGHHILQGQTFRVKILGTAFTPSSATGGVGLNFYCILEGILSRGVQ
jgi:hypothetical protein